MQNLIHFDIAVNRTYYNRQKGQGDDLPTVYYRIVAAGSLADNARESLRKGHEVVVVGSFANYCFPTEDEEKQQTLVLEAQVIAPSLRFATADVKNTQQQGATS